MPINIKWFTPDSEDGERSLKQHAYIQNIQRIKYTHEKYEGNKALCCRSFVSNDGEKYKFDDEWYAAIPSIFASFTTLLISFKLNSEEK